MSGLSIAVAMHKGYADMTDGMEGFNTLQFEDLTDSYWAYDRDNISFSDNIDSVLDEDGNTYSFEVYGRGAVTEDEKYIMFDVDNGCGDRYYVVFSKEKRVQEE